MIGHTVAAAPPTEARPLKPEPPPSPSVQDASSTSISFHYYHLVGFSIRNFLGANGCPRRHRRRRRHWLCVCLCVKGGGAQRQARLHSALFTHPHTKPSCSPRGVQQQGAAIAAACRCHCGLPLTARRFCSSCLLSRCVGSELRAATLPQAQALSLRDWARSRRPCRHAHVARPPWYAPQPRRLIFHGALA